MDKNQPAETLRSVPKDRAARIVGGLLLFVVVVLLVAPLGYDRDKKWGNTILGPHVDCGILVNPKSQVGCSEEFNSRLRATVILGAIGAALVLGSSQLRRRDEDLGEPDPPSDPNVCRWCGATHSEDARFCDATGSPINAET